MSSQGHFQGLVLHFLCAVPANNFSFSWAFPGSSADKESTCNAECRRPWFDSWVGKMPWRRDMLPTPGFLSFLGGSDGKESTCNVGDLGSTPRRSSERGQWQPIPVFLPAWSILMDRGARRATVHGVTESDTAAAAAAGAKSL